MLETDLKTENQNLAHKICKDGFIKIMSVAAVNNIFLFAHSLKT